MPEQRQDLVLVHGWGMNAGIWSGVQQPLAQRFRLHCLELPGHGQRPWQGEKGLNAWTQALLETAPDRAIWLGWSLGGQLALQAALLAPQRVERLLLCTTAPRFVQAQDWPHAMPAEVLEHFAASLQQEHQATLDRFLALQVRGAEDGRATLRQLRAALADRPPARPEALTEGLRLLQGTDLRAALAELSQPVHWCFGERDQIIPAALAQEVARLLPTGNIRVLDRAGHAPFVSHARDWLDWLDWLHGGGLL